MSCRWLCFLSAVQNFETETIAGWIDQVDLQKITVLINIVKTPSLISTNANCQVIYFCHTMNSTSNGYCRSCIMQKSLTSNKLGKPSKSKNTQIFLMIMLHIWYNLLKQFCEYHARKKLPSNQPKNCCLLYPWNKEHFSPSSHKSGPGLGVCQVNFQFLA